MNATFGFRRKPNVHFPGPQKCRLSKGKTEKPPTSVPKFTHRHKGGRGRGIKSKVS